MEEAAHKGLERSKRREKKGRPKMKVSGRGMKRFAGAKKTVPPRRPLGSGSRPSPGAMRRD